MIRFINIIFFSVAAYSDANAADVLMVGGSLLGKDLREKAE
jgi:hypothetical protein